MSLTGFLSYSRINWQQLPDKSTPFNAANLNTMDKGIKNNNDMISNLRDEITDLENKGIVTGIKGNSETTYRTGQVNITAANIGLGNVNNTADGNKSVKYAQTAGSANPVAHASSKTDYGIGTSNVYGHVKLSDSYSVYEGNASNGVGATQAALFNAYTNLSGGKVTNLGFKDIGGNNAKDWVTNIINQIPDEYGIYMIYGGWQGVNFGSTICQNVDNNKLAIGLFNNYIITGLKMKDQAVAAYQIALNQI